MKPDAFVITTDRSRMNLDVIHGYLTRSYWSEGIPKPLVKRAMENSLCFGVFRGEEQVGFARVVSDYSTYAYLCDVFILEDFRGKGLSRRLMREVIDHPSLQGLRRFTLATRDAHELYRNYGFTELKRPERMMEILRPELYRTTPASSASGDRSQP